MTISSWLNFGHPAPREGGLRRGEISGSALLQPARSVCVSSERFFHLSYNGRNLLLYRIYCQHLYYILVTFHFKYYLLCRRLLGGGIKQWCCLTSDDVLHVHCEYSWRPQLLEARRAGRGRPGVRLVWAGAGPQRSGAGAYRGAAGQV